MAKATPAKLTSISVRRAYKFRLYPTAHQERVLLSWLESLCRLYNLELEIRDKAYKERGETLTWKGFFSAWLKDHRKEDLWLARIPCQTCHCVARRLEKAFEAFFRRVKEGSDAPAHPRPRRREDWNSIDFPADQGQVRLVDCKHVRLPILGSVQMKAHRKIEGRLKHVVIKEEVGRWYIIFSCDLGDQPVVKSERPAVGLALGPGLVMGTSCRESGVSVIRLPAPYANGITKTVELDRGIDRALKRHNNRRRLYRRKALNSAVMERQRKDWQHKAARMLVERFGQIHYTKFAFTPKRDKEETQGSNDGQKGRKRRRESADAAWSAFLELLKYKAEERGVELVEIPVSTFDSEDAIPLNPHERARLVLARGVEARAEPRGGHQANLLSRTSLRPMRRASGDVPTKPLKVLADRKPI